MKQLLLCLCLTVALATNAQEDQLPILISAQGKTVKAFALGKNDSNVISLNSKSIEGRIILVNKNAKSEIKMVRQYMLMSDTDEDLQISFSGRIVGTVGAALKDIFEKTKKGQTYMLYTIATPADPKEAALVRVRRVMLCKLEIN